MTEEAYDRIQSESVGRFTFTSLQSRDAFVRRCEEYDADYDVDDHEIDEEWDSATITVSSKDLRPLRYLISTG
jgi:hypothetical protein